MLSQNRREAKPVYSFPELRIFEILQCLEDLRIPVTENDISKPTSSIVLRVYEAFVEIFMGPSVLASFSSGSPASAMVGILEYPELHNKSINLIAFHRILTRLMGEVGIIGFLEKVRPETLR